RIIAGIPSVVMTQTGFEYRADSVLNAQMSLRYNIAVALADRQLYLEQFAPQRIGDPALMDLVGKIDIEIDPDLDSLYPAIYGGRVTIVTRHGQSVTRRVDYSKGMPENPMSRQEIERKYMSLATAGVGARSAA